MYARRLHSLFVQVKPPLAYLVGLLFFCRYVHTSSLQFTVSDLPLRQILSSYSPDASRFDSRHLAELPLFSRQTRNATEPRSCRVAGRPVKRGWGARMRPEALLSLHYPGWPRGRREETDRCQGSPSARELGVLFDRGCLFGWP